ncbi:hypothetical protein [Nocardioides sp. YIM 152588]|uniref:hypothetical protein n=1 Tax=Nocardioides sp. YIM 152588 TaxID=3158259 RepID=UPI0032E372AA
MHPKDLWDFDDPTGSEQRFREAAAAATAPDAAAVWETQVARALGLQERYDEGHRALDAIAPGLGPEVETRVALERGRLLRSAGDAGASAQHFDDAARSAAHAGLEELHLDALHMRIIVAPPELREPLTADALRIAAASSDPRARDWDGALLNNLGMSRADADDFDAALEAFEQALVAFERIGDPARLRVARWMVGWALRNLGRRADALAIQRALKTELDALGEVDPYVDEEIALLEE